MKYFDAKFARIWLIDREKKYLMLKLIAGKYKNLTGSSLVSQISEEKNLGYHNSTENPALEKKTSRVRI